ncbi:MAG: S8 family serine peptidase [Crocinitomicaceae bacterium]|nr:S8 family serine peptidase [Crocinitomicaceae bacterium]
MNRAKIFYLLIHLVICLPTNGQSVAWIFFSDKEGVVFDPYSYFDTMAINRRKREGLSLSDPTDFPVRQDNIEKIAERCDSIKGVSRWFNAVAAYATPHQLEVISQMPFVTETQWMAEQPFLSRCDSSPALEEKEFQLLMAQTERMQYSLLKEKSLSGKGVRVAIFDAGFRGVPTDSVFRHVVANGQVIATHDFVKNKKFVFGYHSHGTEVLSCISGIYQGMAMGCASDAQLLLARTEQPFNESMVNEDNWIESLEWADKWGADIINSSLIYTRQLYFRKDMNGRNSLISRAAAMAYHKGILVVNSAGNDADSPWEIIGAPADADSVLTVGGIDPWTGYHSYFSSYGPTADRRMKPNLSAFGWAMVSNGNGIEMASGTSFAAPLVAGFAACIRQMHPEWPVRQLFEELQKSGDLYPYYDYAHGYGVPQAGYFLHKKNTDIAPTLTSFFNGETDCFEFEIADTVSMEEHAPQKEKSKSVKVDVSHQVFDLSKMRDLVYLHVAKADGVLKRYNVFEPGKKLAAYTDDPYCDDCVIRVFYKGFILEISGKNKKNN